MTLNNPCDYDSDGKRDKHFAMLKSRWEGILKRGNKVAILLNGGHTVAGVLREDSKGYLVWSSVSNSATFSATYIELGDVVGVREFFPYEETDNCDK